jgi:AcrR family transcriptional regulator
VVSVARRVGYKKSEDSRRQILDAAIAVLSRRGLASTSVQDIADAAGVSKGVVHYHFDSKDELLEHVLDRCCESVENRVRVVFEREGTPVERIRRALAEMWVVRREGVAEIRVLTELHVHARQNPAVRKALGAALRKARQQIVDIGLTQLLALGLRPKVPIDVVPRLLLGMLDGLALQHEVDPITAKEEDDVLRALETTAMGLFEL